ncbi:glucose 1-dehydrogenase [Catellatospora citrea]|uniref:glucose 1-dehydrogenase n=1 Tax=Catellatospora citrea TaxID=53366 RepID=UPI0033CAE9BD
MALHGKTAIVTGASRGIGRGIALRLAADGANVVVNYVGNADAAKEVVETITERGGNAVAVQADTASAVDVERLFSEAAAAFGGVDIVVNNAGITVVGPFEALPLDQFDRVVDVNFKGVFYVLQQAARHVRDGGRIVNISTGYTRNPNPYVGAYTATKAAVEHLSFSLSKELGPKQITVNSVLPGLVETEGMAPEARAAMDMVIGMTPLGRVGQPEDIADVVAFLAGPDARWITGQSVAAAGGLA